jgi:pheromone shutdown-related protein TraB
MDNIIIVSTSHVAEESVKLVKKTIEEQKPNVVAVELDAGRFQGLFEKQQRSIPISAIFRIGIGGYLFFVIARSVQQRIGKMVGVMPGAEMKAAVLAARDIKAKIALIDRRIDITVSRLTKNFTWKEKFRLAKDLFMALIGKGEAMEINNVDLTKVPPSQLISLVMGFMKKRYPNVYKVLVEERDEIMAKNLIQIAKLEPEAKIVAVVGAGHAEGLRARLTEGFKKLKTE